jgi:hypothetical protein
MNHPLVARVDGGALSEERRMPRRKTEKAVEIAETKWDKDGARADQDYYHVAGGKNPDRRDPPQLRGKRLPAKPGMRP